MAERPTKKWGLMTVMPDYPCYTDDWQRTRPDRVLYLPAQPQGNDGDNEHLHLVRTPAAGDLLAFWTMGTYESSPDSRTVFSRSLDRGLNWSPPSVLPGTFGGHGLSGRWGFPVLSRSGRIYYFYNKSIGFWDVSYTLDGTMHCVYSDDDGFSWADGGNIPFFRRPGYAHPDPRVPNGWIVWQPPIRDREGRQIAAFTRWSSLHFFPKPVAGSHFDSRSELMRFDNIEEGPDPGELQITWLPKADSISVPCPVEPEKSKGYSLAEEPAAVLLPDGRLFLIMRTRTGRIWYTVSDDDGASWRPAEILRRHDGGPEMLHPKSPCPLYSIGEGRFLLFYHNHDGTGYGAKGPHDMDARRPVFLALGEYRPQACQPVWFSEPKFLFDTDGVALGPGNGSVEGGRTWLALYGCLTGNGNERILWYPDRKHFLLGKCLPDALLADLTVR